MPVNLIMRLHRVLEDLLSIPTGLRVLRILVRFPGRTWTGRELATAAGSSPPQTLKALKRLEHVGMTWRTTVGRAHLWQLVSEHVLVEPVRSLFSFESKLPEGFQEELRSALKGLPLRKAVLFGSVARGTETNDSDVDLYLELRGSVSDEEIQAALTPIAVRFIHRYGAVLSPIIYSRRAVRNPPNPALLTAIEREGVSLLEESA